MSLPRALLDLPIEGLNRAMWDRSLAVSPALPSLADYLEDELRPLLGEEDLSIDLAADILDTSPRTLSRQLKAEGTGWRMIRKHLLHTDLGAELALPITLRRPDDGQYFWQLTPFVQAAGGVSIAFAAGGLFMGGGVVNALGWNHGSFEILMSNEIAYYGRISLNDIQGYDFSTDLSQLYFKNGLEGTWWMGAGFYSGVGIHFTHFAVDPAAESWFATPEVELGWEAGRWFDIRLAYEADVGADDYRSHNLRVKLDFLF
jgi:hypothetical protein